MDETECAFCGNDVENNWFDRTLCACNSMHTRCDDCGSALDFCPFE